MHTGEWGVGVGVARGGAEESGGGEWEERYGVLLVSKLVCFTVNIFIA